MAMAGGRGASERTQAGVGRERRQGEASGGQSGSALIVREVLLPRYFRVSVRYSLRSSLLGPVRSRARTFFGDAHLDVVDSLLVTLVSAICQPYGRRQEGKQQ